MTDNRTTELLREFAENAIYCNQFGSLYADEERIAEYAERIEQAIAATLGKPMEKDLRRALDFMRIWISDDAHLGESEFSYELEKAEGLRRLEAIEQAIAATLGSGTCENVAHMLGMRLHDKRLQPDILRRMRRTDTKEGGRMSEYIYATNGELVANIDGEISLAREEVVRCRDCKWFYCLTIDACVCNRSEEKFMPWVEPGGFCAWGKRKEAENGI